MLGMAIERNLQAHEVVQRTLVPMVAMRVR